MSMRGMWYVFKQLDGEGLYQAVADQVTEISHWPGGWRVWFKCAARSVFLSRRKYATPYIGKRVSL